MIKFALVCEKGHDFESWFSDGASYDKQVRRGLVACSACGSTRVGKAIMAPAVVSRSPAKRPGTEGLAESANAGVPVALIDERHRALRDAMRTLRREIESRTEDVGAKFPDVARAIQAGDGPERAIRGQAKPEEVEALLEEGIGVLPMPYAPDDFN